MSIWNINEKNRKTNTLNKDIATDTLIIGAGLTGMTLAYYLKDNKDVVIVDANKYGHGVTLNSTAKITYLQERVYTKIKKLNNYCDAKVYLASQKYAINNLIEIISKEKINCDLVNTPSYIFANTEKEVEPLKKEYKFLKDNGINIKEAKLPNKVTSYLSYKVDDTYTFNPLKYLDGIYNVIESKVKIYEDTKIINIKKENDMYLCYTKDNCIKAKNVIIACHYPFFLFPFLLPLKGTIEKSYMIVSKVKKDLGCSMISTSSPTYSCRYYKNGNKTYQISLAESHNTAFKQNDSYHFNRVKEIFNLKEEDIIDEYSNVDIISHDHMPYIGKIKDNMYISTGYNTWGMTNSILGAKIISDIIKGEGNSFIKTFNPLRKNMALFIKTPINIIYQTKSFMGPKLFKNKPWYPSNIKFFYENGKSLAYYKDNEGNKHIVYNKCPHLGCSLIFNEREKTWDCPCHSSRFNIDGKCIKGPSLWDISYKEDKKVD